MSFLIHSVRCKYQDGSCQWYENNDHILHRQEKAKFQAVRQLDRNRHMAALNAETSVHMRYMKC